MDLRFRQRGLRRQLRVHRGDTVRNQPVDLVARGEIGVARIGDAPLVGPSADSSHVNVDERANHVAAIAESDRFPDIGQEFEFVFDQPRRIRGAILQGADMRHAVDDPQVPVSAEIAGVAGMEPAVGIFCLRGGRAGRGGIP